MMADWYRACPGRWLRRTDYAEAKEWDTGVWSVNSPYARGYATAAEAIEAFETEERHMNDGRM